MNNSRNPLSKPLLIPLARLTLSFLTVSLLVLSLLVLTGCKKLTKDLADVEKPADSPEYTVGINSAEGNTTRK